MHEQGHHCGRCQGNGESSGPLLAGWPLAAASACVFLPPLMLAALGALCVRREPLWQAVAALVGFAAGVALARQLVRLARFGREERS